MKSQLKVFLVIVVASAGGQLYSLQVGAFYNFHKKNDYTIKQVQLLAESKEQYFVLDLNANRSFHIKKEDLVKPPEPTAPPSSKEEEVEAAKDYQQEVEEQAKRRECDVSAMYANDLWLTGRLTFTRSFFITSGSVRDFLPSGERVTLAYDEGIDDLVEKRYFWFPGLRSEIQYFNLSEELSSVKGITTEMGPIWLIAPWSGKFGQLMISAVAGASFLAIQGRSLADASVAFTAAGIGGYEYFFGRLGITLQTRYIYIADSPAVESLGINWGVVLIL